VSVSDGGEATRWLDALLALARTSRNQSVEDTLVAVASTIQTELGYGAVVVNIYRPAQHDYEAAIVLADPEAQAAVLHTTHSYELLHEQLLLPQFEQVPGVYLLSSGHEAWDHLDTAYTPGSDHGDWKADDGILVVLTSTDGEPLGLLSLDRPVVARHPTIPELEMLAAVSAHAALALETAQRNRATARHHEVLVALAGFAAQLGTDITEVDVLERVCAVSAQTFGFGSATVFLRELDVLVPVAGSVLRFVAVPADVVGPDGSCRVVCRPAFHGGRGQAAAGPSRVWRDDLLLVPLHGPGGVLVGLLVLDEPLDGLRPDTATGQALRLLADQAVAALANTRHRLDLDHQARHDILTGVENRRDLPIRLENLAGAPGGGAVLLCDLDHFKTVNDRFGHDVGDTVLGRFGELLRQHCRSSDVIVRYGGEEFCLLLAGVGDAAARTVAERLRRGTPAHLGEVVAGQTVSIGIATTDVVVGDGATLLRAADTALYAAKQHGRDACFAATASGDPERVAGDAVAY
jgi:diguanylate cyclase (GGDEF)-like protein